MRLTQFTMIVLTFWCSVSVGTSLADVKEESRQAANLKLKASAFDTAIKRAAVVAAGKEWMDEDWSDEELQASVNKILSQVKKLTKHKLLKLPVTFDSVRPAINQNRRVLRDENRLVVGKRLKITRARNSIILAEEIADVGYADNCIILSRGVVEIAHGNSNFILAGHYANVSFDGHHPRGGNKDSVLISGGIVHISHAKNSICAVPKMVEIAHGTNVKLINSPNVSHRHNFLTLDDKTNTLPKGRRTHPLMEKLEITEIVRVRRPKSRAFVVTKTPIGEMVTRVGDSIANPGPDPKSYLDGWKLAYIGHRFAFFVKGQELASAYLPRKR